MTLKLIKSDTFSKEQNESLNKVYNFANDLNLSESLKRDMEVLTELHKEFKLALDDLEKLVKQ